MAVEIRLDRCVCFHVPKLQCNVINKQSSVYHTQLLTSVIVSHLSPLRSFIPVELELASFSLGVSSVDVCSLVLSGIDTAALSSLPASTNKSIQT